MLQPRHLPLRSGDDCEQLEADADAKAVNKIGRECREKRHHPHELKIYRMQTAVACKPSLQNRTLKCAKMRVNRERRSEPGCAAER